MSQLAARYNFACLAAGAALCALLGLAMSTVQAQGNAAPALSGGCGKSTAARGHLTLTTVDGKHSARSYVLSVPAGYVPTRPYPLIFVFHGAGQNSAQSESWNLQRAPGAADAGIFVYPNGVAFQHYGIGWDDRSDGYDLPFFDNMLKDVEAAYCIDSGKIFVAGFSWGGDFALALACNRGDIIRAIAANSTTDEFKDRADYRTYADLPCSSQRHPPLRFEHAVQGDSQYPAPFFATTSKLVQYLNSCNAAASPVASSTPAIACVAYAGCLTDYVECSFDKSLGHTLPPNWPQDTWAFFMDHAGSH